MGVLEVILIIPPPTLAPFHNACELPDIVSTHLLDGWIGGRNRNIDFPPMEALCEATVKNVRLHLVLSTTSGVHLKRHIAEHVGNLLVVQEVELQNRPLMER